MKNSPAVELRSLTKIYATVTANDSVSLSVKHGSIHAIVGENGAGKSTAMKLLYGMIQPDSGEILINGKPRRWRSPAEAIGAGIGMVHQHFMLAGPYSALENVVLGSEPVSSSGWWPRAFRSVGFAAAREKLRAISRDHGFKIDWDAPIESLPVGVQQQIEIVKLLYRDARILILDEPTAVLTPQETEELFHHLRRLRDDGRTILIITHKLKEVMALSDRVTVFRSGKVSGEVDTGKTSVDELAQLMVGRKVVLQAEAPPPSIPREAVLEMDHVTTWKGRCRLGNLRFVVRGGEVVGIAGVEGNGQSELLRMLLHPTEFENAVSGKVRLFGKTILDDSITASTQDIKDMGVGVIPEDRHLEGLLLDRPVAENFLLGLQGSFSRLGFIDSRRLGAQASQALETYDVRPRSLTVNARTLSGGNQQKLIIAREFERKPGFLIAAQPTRGVDVGAIEFIHQRILDSRTSGAAVLLVSSELDEVMALSDRILVMYGGRIVAEFERGKATEEELGLCMGGAGPAEKMA